VIAAALLLQAAAPVTVAQVGPFAVVTHVSRSDVSSYPRPQGYESKSTLLQWKSPSGLTVYSLIDDGEFIAVSYHIVEEHGSCIGNQLVRLRAQPSVHFRIDCPILSGTKAKRLTAEMRAARPYFRAAYNSFYKATLQQHGPGLQRCRETTFGNHGQICAAYWDEGRSVNDQQKNKRTN
jgi:hypothetical protein